MIFYIANKPTGGRQLCTTQVEAKAIDKEFAQLDIPVDKTGLRDVIQELLDLADANGSTETQEAEIKPETPQIEAQSTSRPAIDMTTLSREERKKLCYPRNVDLLDREYFEAVWHIMPMPLRLDLISLAMDDFRQFWLAETKRSQSDESANSSK